MIFPSYSGCCVGNWLKMGRSRLGETTIEAPVAFQVRDDDGLQTRVLVGDKQKYACLAYVLDVDLTGLVMDWELGVER